MRDCAEHQEQYSLASSRQVSQPARYHHDFCRGFFVPQAHLTRPG